MTNVIKKHSISSSTLSKATRRFWPASPPLRVWRHTEEGFPLRWTAIARGQP
jgi:hypothetical protein